MIRKIRKVSLWTHRAAVGVFDLSVSKILLQMPNTCDLNVVRPSDRQLSMITDTVGLQLVSFGVERLFPRILLLFSDQLHFPAYTNTISDFSQKHCQNVFFYF